MKRKYRKKVPPYAIRPCKVADLRRRWLRTRTRAQAPLRPKEAWRRLWGAVGPEHYKPDTRFETSKALEP